MSDRKLWFEGRTFDQINDTRGKDGVIYNLHEDCLCMSEHITELKEEKSELRLLASYAMCNYFPTDSLLHCFSAGVENQLEVQKQGGVCEVCELQRKYNLSLKGDDHE